MDAEFAVNATTPSSHVRACRATPGACRCSLLVLVPLLLPLAAPAAAWADGPCTGDLDGSGAVDGQDLGALLAQWGGAGTSADLDGNGTVGGGDLGALLAHWGACPCSPPAFAPLYPEGTALEPEVLQSTPDALVTRLGDRARDRHAREDIVNGVPFRKYDHWLPFYWEQRIAEITIEDRVAMGGTGVVFRFVTHDRLDPAEFRTFYANAPSVAQYHNNMSDFPGQGVTLVSQGPSATVPGETEYRYSATLLKRFPDQVPLGVGDRIEVELSQFLQNPRNGRENYYGTAFLYVVGRGVVPWYARDKEEAETPQEREAASFDSFELPEWAWLGGRGTLPYQYSNEPLHRFKQMVGNVSPASAHAFVRGRRLHHTSFVTGAHSEPDNPAMSEHAGKAGPRFINTSCVACHVNNGRALPPQVGQPLLRGVVRVAGSSMGEPHPLLGDELQPAGPAAEGAAVLAGWQELPGTYGDGTPFSLRRPVWTFTGTAPQAYSVRMAPALVGLGLLEAVGESEIASRADECDADGDGVSGRMSVADGGDASSGTALVGRLGLKATQPSVRHQVARALNRDMGVATALAPVLDNETRPSPPELSDADLGLLTRYVSLLGVAARRSLTDPQALHGEAIFAQLGCTACHAPSLTTGAHHPMAELRNQVIHPYTDLLLHDLGPGLADTMPDGDATASEWRTAPLWNIGLTPGVAEGEAYLHDGRARTLHEAILWHGGEAEAAREGFRTLPAADREALVAFLRSL